MLTANVKGEKRALALKGRHRQHRVLNCSQSLYLFNAKKERERTEQGVELAQGWSTTSWGGVRWGQVQRRWRVKEQFLLVPRSKKKKTRKWRAVKSPSILDNCAILHNRSNHGITNTENSAPVRQRTYELIESKMTRVRIVSIRPHSLSWSALYHA